MGGIMIDDGVSLSDESICQDCESSCDLEITYCKGDSVLINDLRDAYETRGPWGLIDMVLDLAYPKDDHHEG